MSHPRKWLRRTSLAVAAIAALSTAWFGMHSYHTFVLLRSAYEAGMPQASAVRGWMTLRYVASIYRVPETRLIAGLNLPPATAPDASLMSLAERQGKSPFQYVKEVQRSLAEVAPVSSSTNQNGPQGWLDWLNDRLLSALLRYGYAILALILLLDALGLPVPGGVTATVGGSLSAAGRLDWLLAGTIAIAACVLGDAVIYGLGRVASEQFLARRGRWFGYSSERQARARALFARWGVLTVLMTRTLAAQMSALVSLLAGMSHYRPAAFLSLALVGRVLWTAAYLGLGFAIGGSFEAAADFLKHFSGLLLSITALAGSVLVASGRFRLGAPGRE